MVWIYFMWTAYHRITLIFLTPWNTTLFSAFTKLRWNTESFFLVRLNAIWMCMTTFRWNGDIIISHIEKCPRLVWKRYMIYKPKMKAFRRVTQNVQLENGTPPIFCIRRFRIFRCNFSIGVRFWFIRFESFVRLNKGLIVKILADRTLKKIVNSALFDNICHAPCTTSNFGIYYYSFITAVLTNHSLSTQAAVPKQKGKGRRAWPPVSITNLGFGP